MDATLRRQHSEKQIFPPKSPRTAGHSGAWAEVFQACNKGFQDKMNVLGAEIVKSVQVEITSALERFRHEMVELQRPVSSSLKDITERAVILQESIDEANNLLSKSGLDLTPVIDEMRAAEVLQRDSDQKLAQANEHMTAVTKLLEQIHKDSGEQFIQLTGKFRDSDVKLSEVSQNIHESNVASKDITSSVKELQEQSLLHFEEITGNLSGLDEQLSNARPGMTSEDNPMLLAMENTQEQVNLSFNHVLHEISSIQKALQMDFDAGPSEGCVGKPVRTADGKISLIDVEAKSEARQIMQGTLAEMKGVKAFGSLRKRMRELCTQTETIDKEDQWIQTMPVVDKPKRRKSVRAGAQKKANPDQLKVGLDASELRRKARQALMRPQYSVFDVYYEIGCAQRIAKSPIFETVTLAVVAVNSIWLAIDTDYNTADILIDSHPIFQVMENTFAVFFVVELLIRFLAFEGKRNALNDGWFLFDLFLIVFMVLDTWVLSITYLIVRETGQSLTLDISIVKTIRVFKLLRLSRVAKLLKQLPELIIIVKGVGAAARSVGVFFILWLIIIYVFSVLITQIASGNDGLEVYFKTVLESMNTLLLQGVFPNTAVAINAMAGANWMMWPIMVSFVLLVGITTMYMLVGVLVEVMGVVATNEKEGLTVSALANSLRHALENIGFNLHNPILQHDLTGALTLPDIAKIVTDVGVDVVVLMDTLDLIYEQAEKQGAGGLTFESLMDAILDMRGSNPASVKDIKEHLRMITKTLKEAAATMTKELTEQLDLLKADVQAIRDDDGKDSDSDSDAGKKVED